MSNSIPPPTPPQPTRIHGAAGGGRATASPLGVYVLRLVPGQQLMAELGKFVLENGLQAPFILSCVGSATKATIRLASATPDKPNEVSFKRLHRVFTLHSLAVWQIITLTEWLEILSLVGTLTPPHRNHVHISFGDKNGRVIGGHLIEMEGGLGGRLFFFFFSPRVQFTQRQRL
jgi:predicted DNA-binding protein with PD1-like motif